MHELKTWPEPFEAILSGKKLHEVRKNDRGFEVGDRLALQEYDPESGRYSGRAVFATVTYITSGAWGIPDSLCVMSIQILERRLDGKPLAFHREASK